jgi:hypothetical protein
MARDYFGRDIAGLLRAARAIKPMPAYTGPIYAYPVMRRIQLTGIAAVVVLAGLMVGACGSSSTSSSGGSSPKASPTPTPTNITAVQSCQLVTLDDAVSLTGNSAVTNLSAAQISGTCVYGSPDGATSVLVFSQLFPDSTSADAVSAETIAASMNASGSGVANAKAVDGIGKKAIEYTFNAGTQGSGLMIFVFKANVVFLIAVAPAPTDATQLATLTGKLETLAKKAADSLH